MMVIDFMFQHLGSGHSTVSRLARQVFILAARNTAADSITFSQVWELLGALDPTLQIRMKKRLTGAVEADRLGGAASLSSLVSSGAGESGTTAPRTPQEQHRSAFLERFLSECSNQHAEPGGQCGAGRSEGWCQF